MPIVKDKSTNKSRSFPTTKQGYAEAANYARALFKAGRKVGGDLSTIAYQESGGRTNVFKF